MLQNLVSLLNQNRMLDFGPTKNTQCCVFFFFTSLGGKTILFVVGGRGAQGIGFFFWGGVCSCKGYFLTDRIPQITGRILWLACGYSSGKWQ